MVKIFQALLIILFAALPALAGEAGTKGKQPEKPATVKEETIILDTREKVIREKDYFSATSLEIGSEQDDRISISAGASIRAREVTITQRRVRGRVYFKSDFHKLNDLINKRIRYKQ